MGGADEARRRGRPTMAGPARRGWRPQGPDSARPHTGSTGEALDCSTDRQLDSATASTVRQLDSSSMMDSMTQFGNRHLHTEGWGVIDERAPHRCARDGVCEYTRVSMRGMVHVIMQARKLVHHGRTGSTARVQDSTGMCARLDMQGSMGECARHHRGMCADSTGMCAYSTGMRARQHRGLRTAPYVCTTAQACVHDSTGMRAG